MNFGRMMVVSGSCAIAAYVLYRISQKAVKNQKEFTKIGWKHGRSRLRFREKPHGITIRIATLHDIPSLIRLRKLFFERMNYEFINIQSSQFINVNKPFANSHFVPPSEDLSLVLPINMNNFNHKQNTNSNSKENNQNYQNNQNDNVNEMNSSDSKQHNNSNVLDKSRMSLAESKVKQDEDEDPNHNEINHNQTDNKDDKQVGISQEMNMNEHDNENSGNDKYNNYNNDNKHESKRYDKNDLGLTDVNEMDELPRSQSLNIAQTPWATPPIAENIEDKYNINNISNIENSMYDNIRNSSSNSNSNNNSKSNSFAKIENTVIEKTNSYDSDTENASIGGPSTIFSKSLTAMSTVFRFSNNDTNINNNNNNNNTNNDNNNSSAHTPRTAQRNKSNSIGNIRNKNKSKNNHKHSTHNNGAHFLHPTNTVVTNTKHKNNTRSKAKRMTLWDFWTKSLEFDDGHSDSNTTTTSMNSHDKNYSSHGSPRPRISGNMSMKTEYGTISSKQSLSRSRIIGNYNYNNNNNSNINSNSNNEFGMKCLYDEEGMKMKMHKYFELKRVNYDYDIMLQKYFHESISSSNFVGFLAFDIDSTKPDYCIAASGIVISQHPPSPENISGKIACILDIVIDNEYIDKSKNDEYVNLEFNIENEMLCQMMDWLKVNNINIVSMHRCMRFKNNNNLNKNTNNSINNNNYTTNITTTNNNNNNNTSTPSNSSFVVNNLHATNKFGFDNNQDTHDNYNYNYNYNRDNSFNPNLIDTLQEFEFEPTNEIKTRIKHYN